MVVFRCLQLHKHVFMSHVHVKLKPEMVGVPEWLPHKLELPTRARSWTREEEHPGDSPQPDSAAGRRDGAALVAPPLVLNKLHYPGCQSGRNIIHPGLSSQAHSNTPSFSLYLLIFPNKNIESTSFHPFFFFNNFFPYTNKAWSMQKRRSPCYWGTMNYLYCDYWTLFHM